MLRSVPARWLDYQCYGKPINNTKIIAFKVPLKVEICRNLLPSDQFTPEMLMNSFPNLKYIIDLTDTTRYYRTTDFTDLGVEYVKIAIPGHVVPKRRHRNRFYEVMDKFMALVKDDELIGVHCTHGLNRTGFLICYYLMKRFKWTASDTIKEFEEARGHTIERSNYRQALESFDFYATPEPSDDNLINEKTNDTSSPRKRRRLRPSRWDQPESKNPSNYECDNWRDYHRSPSSSTFYQDQLESRKKRDNWCDRQRSPLRSKFHRESRYERENRRDRHRLPLRSRFHRESRYERENWRDRHRSSSPSTSYRGTWESNSHRSSRK